MVIEPEDSARLCEAILKLYQDEVLRTRLGENGYRAVQQYYNREIMAERMLQVIIPQQQGAIPAANVSSGERRFY